MSSDRSRIGLFCLASFSLLGFDLACTYITFAIKGMPLGYEMNPWFRLWMIRDGWALSFAKFFLLKAMLFALWAMVVILPQVGQEQFFMYRLAGV
jgi:hypothetical protein